MRTIAASVALLALGGCVLFPQTGPAPTGVSAHVVDASPDQVWEVLAEVFGNLGLPVFEVDPTELSLVSSRAVNVWGPFLGPANTPYARCTVPTFYRTLAAVARPGVSANQVPVSLPSGRVVVSVVTRLAGDDARTRMETRVHLSPVGMLGGARGEPYCVSTGRLERRIAESVDRRVAERSPPGSA